MNREQVIERSTFRKAQIEGSAARIQKKIDDMPDDRRVPAWRQRMEQYALSVECINLSLKTGSMIYVNGARPTAADTVISPPAANMKLEGK